MSPVRAVHYVENCFIMPYRSFALTFRHRTSQASAAHAVQEASVHLLPAPRICAFVRAANRAPHCRFSTATAVL